MTFDSSGIIVLLAVLFVVLGIVTSLVYYFARYYFKTDPNDKELLTKKPLEYGIHDPRLDEVQKNSTETTFSQVENLPQFTPPASSKPQTMNRALENTRSSFWSRMKNALSGKTSISPELKNELEEILFTNDLGPQTAELLMTAAIQSLSQSEVSVEKLRQQLKNEMLSIFNESQSRRMAEPFEHFQKSEKPQVLMVTGVNGVGKTTTIGKLASHAAQIGLKTMIVAGDTFRAAADEQLKVWAQRANVEYFSAPQTKDPSAVAYSALEKAKSEKYDLIIVDTAGRLHTQSHLMEELKKMERVMKKVIPDAPQEKWIVLDANSGQNALMQAREFHLSLGLTGCVITKLDGSAKGGILVGISQELKLPVCFVGIGEKVEDLRSFQAEEFVEALIHE